MCRVARRFDRWIREPLSLEAIAVWRLNLPMNVRAEETLEGARQLPPSEIGWLIGELLRHGDGPAEDDLDASWKAEVERRVADALNEAAPTLSWEEVEAPLRARLVG
jgi:putative addiction module component (TIGR02574 family)